MLKKIEAVKGIGLFHDAGSTPQLGHVALLFGENGTGKSTLASILRSCAEGDPAILAARSTLGGTETPGASLTLLDSSGTDVPVELSNGSWSTSIPHLEVFDADFVNRNVYAGAEITADQRANLLEFALGERAVDLHRRVDAAAAKLNEATEKVTNQNAILKVHAGTLTVDAFIKLPPCPNADAEIAELEKRIAGASARDALLAKAIPAPAPTPTLDLATLFKTLQKSLPDIEESAERTVKEHLKRCSNPRFERWLAEGSSYVTGDECPYCGSNVQGSALLKAYQAHFNQAYGELRTQAVNLRALIERQLSDAVVTDIERSVETAQARAEDWKGYTAIGAVTFDSAGMKGKLKELRDLLTPLAERKSSSPLEAVGSRAEWEKARELWSSTVKFVETTNTQIVAVNSAIATYKESLKAENVQALRAEIQSRKDRARRHSQPVLEEVEKLRELAAFRKACSDEKQLARDDLDALMKDVLARYQVEINTLLAGFHTQVRIENLGFHYRGSPGLPRTDYHLKVRGHDVPLAGFDIAAFGSALSEGDKRSLAFAFFIARLHQDPDLADKVVVIDDPMCSLDRRRRAATLRVLKVLATKCRQLIVLAHDAYFLQALDDELRQMRFSKTGRVVSYCKLVATGTHNYSSFDAMILDKECASIHEKNLKAIRDYLDAEPGASAEYAAKCLRVVLEASLHRQFPSYIDRSAMLGTVITAIENARAPNPLTALAGQVGELRALNDYAKKFHHSDDGTPPDLAALDEGELRCYADRVLRFVYRG